MRNKTTLLGLTILLIAVGIVGWRQYTIKQRQTEIHAKGSQVMPFDLEKTTHVFENTDEGGLQQVRAKDPSDTDQINLIQAHLREEADRFSQGDFSDPAQLHGEDMPGLAELQDKATQLDVEYQDLTDGGQILYKTNDQEVLAAIHLWFMAQLQDHGPDAVHNPDMMH